MVVSFVLNHPHASTNLVATKWLTYILWYITTTYIGSYLVTFSSVRGKHYEFLNRAVHHGGTLVTQSRMKKVGTLVAPLWFISN
jgi:hypothetical protein